MRLIPRLAAAALLLSLPPLAAAQGFNAGYLPFSESRMRRFPLKRHEAEGLRGGRPLVVSGVRLREETEERAGEEAANFLVFSGRDLDGKEWEVRTEGIVYHEAVYEGDLDRNGVRDLVFAAGTGGNGLAPPRHLVFLTFDRRGHPGLFEATGYFDARASDIYDLTDLDGDGRAELLFMVYDDGYWITNLYRVRDARWSRVEGRFAGLRFPAYTRFTNRPNHRPVRPAPGRNPRAPDLLKRDDAGEQSAGAAQAGEEDEAAAAARFLAELQRAVAAGERREVSRMVLYPLKVRIRGRRVVLRGPRQFLARYDALFNPHVKSVLAAQKFEGIFRNWQGYMVGRGEVWFEQLADTGEFKVIAVNNTAP
ncbi:MAG TPA: hypothetical protein VG148_19730 [Pyrinomonadaceae bacterium]|nr:hypothetical protein [Pyrinomonadaceae bacterium]